MNIIYNHYNEIEYLTCSCEDSRVVMVSSGGMLTVRLDPVDLSFDAMKPYDGRIAYSQNKRQLVNDTNLETKQKTTGISKLMRYARKLSRKCVNFIYRTEREREH